MYPYAIGLDIGITSVGWATVALDEEEKPCGIIRMGVRIFDAAERPKDGSSLAKPRREARSMRRRLRRKRHRKERIRQLIITSGLLDENQLSSLYEGEPEDIYVLRVKALDERITEKQLAKILIHISQRRGFKSNRRNATSAEDGKLLEAVKANKDAMKSAGYRSPAELMLNDARFTEHKRNKAGNYISTVTRDMVADEVHSIFEEQRRHNNAFAGADLEEAYLSILLSQRSFDEGPGGNSKYGGNQIEKMVGRCKFEPEEMRAAKATYSFQYFNLLEKLNHLRLISSSESRTLDENQRRQIIELAFKSENLNYDKIRKTLGISDEYTFNLVRYDSKSSAQDTEKKEKLNYLKSYHEIRKAVERVSQGSFALLSNDDLDRIGTALTLYKTDSKIIEMLTPLNLSQPMLEELCKLSFSKFGNLSVKALKKIIPYLEEGKNYSEACESAGYEFRGHMGNGKDILLHPKAEDYEDITSPVVKRAVAQSIKVINAIIRERGCSPTYINIELAREMAKDFTERNRILKENKENQTANEKILEQIKKEYKIPSPSGQDIVKLKLWKEQDGRSAYSQRAISIERLFESGYAEVDHIVPYSISFDDTFKNKVLVLSKENRDKGNRLPLQYLVGEDREHFIVWANSCVRNYRKKNLLLKESITEDDYNSFKERNLQDTKHMSAFLMNYIRDNLQFAPSRKRKKKVTAVSGMITSYMRKRWGISKVRENGDCHHAVDALVIACTTDYMIQQITKYSQFRECEYMQYDDRSFAVSTSTGEVLREFPYPWPMFRRELDARTCDNPARAVIDAGIPFYLEDNVPEVKPIFVSRMPKRSITGAAHKETIKSAKIIDEGYTLSKTDVKNLKLKDGEIENYYNPGSDVLLYNALKARLAEYEGDAKKAFAEPFYKPKRDGSRGPLVRTVKLMEKATLSVGVHGNTAVADNDTMVRVDVFHIENEGYYLVPIYIADTLKESLPNRACVAHKPYDDWKEVDDKDFIFSLYPNDLVKIEQSKPLKMSLRLKDSNLAPQITVERALLYYQSTNISSGAVKVITNDNAYMIESLGLKTLKSLEKYEVDVLGNYYLVRNEKRMKFNQGGK